MGSGYRKKRVNLRETNKKYPGKEAGNPSVTEAKGQLLAWQCSWGKTPMARNGLTVTKVTQTEIRRERYRTFLERETV